MAIVIGKLGGVAIGIYRYIFLKKPALDPMNFCAN